MLHFQIKELITEEKKKNDTSLPYTKTWVWWPYAKIHLATDPRTKWIQQQELSDTSQIIAGLASLAADEWSLGTNAPVSTPKGYLGWCRAGVFWIMSVALAEFSKNNEATI